jgi:hypothetical protein
LATNTACCWDAELVTVLNLMRLEHGTIRRLLSGTFYTARFLGLTVFLSQQIPCYGADFSFALGTIKDTRATDNSSSLMIELKIAGKDVDDVLSANATVTTALTSGGTNLAEHTGKMGEAVHAISDKDPSEDRLFLRLKFKSPASRREEMIKKLAGSVEMFIPKRDPASVLDISDIPAQSGKPIDFPALKAAGASVTVFLQKEYEAFRQQDTEASGKKEKTPARSGTSSRAEKAFMEHLSEESRDFFNQSDSGSLPQINERSIAVEIRDPGRKLSPPVFFTKDDQEIKPSSTRSSYSAKHTIMVYEFRNVEPAALLIQFYVNTEKALVKQSFELTDIPLP